MSNTVEQAISTMVHAPWVPDSTEGRRRVEELARRLAVAAHDAGLAEARAGSRLFPIMDAPDIPWSVIQPCESQALKNHSQTLKRLAERGGLGAGEAFAVLTHQSLRKVFHGPDAPELLEKLVKERQLAPRLYGYRETLVREIGYAEDRSRGVIDPGLEGQLKGLGWALKWFDEETGKLRKGEG